jgi:hypothetical protein
MVGKSKSAAARRKPKRVCGRVPGVSVPATAKSAAASRVAGWKHGLRAQVVTPLEARRAEVSKIDPDAPALFDAYAAALVDGDTSGVDQVNVVGMVETELLRRRAVDSVRERGVVIEEAMVNSEGAEIGTRIKAHPALEPLRWMNEQLGNTAADTQLSRKSRGEGAVNAAMAARLARDAMLRGHDKSSMPAPPSPPARKEIGS